MHLKHLKLRVFVLIMLGLFMILSGDVAFAVGVRPLVIEMIVRPGDERDFVIDLIPDTMEELVDLVLYEPVQQLSGGLTYQLPVNPGFSATSWVTFDNDSIRVLPGQDTRVTGTVRVPFSASGSHTVVMMVESRPPDDPSGFTFRVRYAVRLRILVERAGIRPTAELNSLEIGPDQQGAPRITARFQNTSALDYLVSGEVTIRDQDRRLVERVTLRTPAGSSTGTDTTRVYPGAEVEFAGSVTRPLTPGEYWIQAFLRYGESGQILRNETIVVNPGEYVFPGFGELAAIAVSPSVTDHELHAGERKSQIFEFESMVGEPVRVEIALGEIMPDYEYSLVDWIELRSQPEFVLPARVKTRLAMTIAVPRDSVDGSYHGKAMFKAYSPVSGSLLSESVVPINVLVGTEQRRDIQIRSLTAQTTEEGTYLSLDVVNNGNVAFLPQISAVISDKDGVFVERVIFALQEERGILPRQTKHMMALAATLEAGTYNVEIEVTYGGVGILTEIHEVVVSN
ncbi:MAG TPA: hypothetical protein DDZ66_06905 [Firmicutes bacterium]|jgi:hypothetical protein|nr:hypothetical protein [Bacillota bacterium]